MAQNDVAVRLYPEPFSADGQAQVAAPAADESMLQKIAEATADVVVVIAQSILDWSSLGMMHPATREATGNSFVTLYGLQEAAAGRFDFHIVARQQGKQLLRQRYAALRQPEGPDLDERTIDNLLAHALDILERVTADEHRVQAN